MTPSALKEADFLLAKLPVTDSAGGSLANFARWLVEAYILDGKGGWCIEGEPVEDAPRSWEPSWVKALEEATGGRAVHTDA